MDNAEARVGRHGSIKASGRLPLQPSSKLGGTSINSNSGIDAGSGTDTGNGGKGSSRGSRRSSDTGVEGVEKVTVDLGNLDLRLSNLYAGRDVCRGWKRCSA